ncbi:MAG: hypothetical protein WA191_03395, partial [Telluria sp.]
EQAVQRLDAVSVNQFHSSSTPIVDAGSTLDPKASTASAWLFMVPELLRNSQSAPFTPRPKGRGFSEQI